MANGELRSARVRNGLGRLWTPEAVCRPAIRTSQSASRRYAFSTIFSQFSCLSLKIL